MGCTAAAVWSERAASEEDGLVAGSEVEVATAAAVATGR